MLSIVVFSVVLVIVDFQIIVKQTGIMLSVFKLSVVILLTFAECDCVASQCDGANFKYIFLLQKQNIFIFMMEECTFAVKFWSSRGNHYKGEQE
jgi:hypothetical protein